MRVGATDVGLEQEAVELLSVLSPCSLEDVDVAACKPATSRNAWHEHDHARTETSPPAASATLLRACAAFDGNLSTAGLPAEVAATVRQVQLLLKEELQLDQPPQHISATLMQQLPRPLAEAAREMISIAQQARSRQGAHWLAPLRGTAHAHALRHTRRSRGLESLLIFSLQACRYALDAHVHPAGVWSCCRHGCSGGR